MDGQCPRCGADVSELSRRCRECLLQLVPGEDLDSGQTALLRRTWEREHPDAVEAFERWAAAADGTPPPGASYRPPEVQRPLGPWQPFGSRLTAVLVALAALVVVDVLAAGSALAMGADEERDALFVLIRATLWLATAVVWIRWFHRAYQNIDALPTAVRRYEPSWALFSWFVPILGLFRPKQMANDLWLSGDPKGDLAEPPFLLLAWWLGYLLSWSLTKFPVAAGALDLVTALLAARVAIEITRRMEARRAEVTA